MIQSIFDLLKLRSYIGVSETIDIAKGKYKIPLTYKEAYKQFKMDLAWLSKKQ